MDSRDARSEPIKRPAARILFPPVSLGRRIRAVFRELEATDAEARAFLDDDRSRRVALRIMLHGGGVNLADYTRLHVESQREASAGPGDKDFELALGRKIARARNVSIGHLLHCAEDPLGRFHDAEIDMAALYAELRKVALAKPRKESPQGDNG